MRTLSVMKVTKKVNYKIVKTFGAASCKLQATSLKLQVNTSCSLKLVACSLNYLIPFINLFHLGPLSQLNHIKDAFPTISVSGTKPQ